MTPANQLPQPPTAPSLAQAFVGMAAQFLGPQGSGRRMLFGAVGAAVIALNHKLGFNLDFNEQSLLAGVVLGVVAASNTKEALVTRALYAGQTAEAIARHEANAQIATAQAQADVDDPVRVPAAPPVAGPAPAVPPPAAVPAGVPS
jgi:hypothetical protein